MTETRPVPNTSEAPGEEELSLIDAYWRAANYLSVGQIYLLNNPLLREPLEPEQVQPRLHLLGLEWLAQERIVQQVDLPHREVVRGTPVRVDQRKLLLARRFAGVRDGTGLGHARHTLVRLPGSPPRMPRPGCTALQKGNCRLTAVQSG